MHKTHAQCIMRLERDDPGPAHHGHIGLTTCKSDPKDDLRFLIYELNASQNADSTNMQNKETGCLPAVPHDAKGKFADMAWRSKSYNIFALPI
jgi:hypothetical protein